MSSTEAGPSAHPSSVQSSASAPQARMDDQSAQLPLPSAASSTCIAAAVGSSVDVSVSVSVPISSQSQAQPSTAPASLDATPPPIALSKSQQKKLKRKSEWDATKTQRRAAERAKRKESKKRKREREEQEVSQVEAQVPGDGDGQGERGDEQKEKEKERQREEKVRKDEEWKARPRFNATLVIDLGFDELMAHKEITSMRSQLAFLYGANQRAQMPFSRIVLTGPGPSKLAGTLPPSQRSSSGCSGAEKDGGLESKLPTKEEGGKEAPSSNITPSSAAYATPHISAELDGYASLLRTGVVPSIYEARIGQKMGGPKDAKGDWSRWKGVQLFERGGLEGFVQEMRREKGERKTGEEVIYLTADTEETIEVLEEGKTYVVGGIVDRNRHKNLCLDKARTLSLRVARLPLDAQHLGESRALNSKAVLTVNQVVQILLGWTQHRRWAPALDEALPERKFDRAKWERSRIESGLGRRVGREGIARGKEDEEEMEEGKGIVIEVDEEAEEEAFNRAAEASAEAEGR